MRIGALKKVIKCVLLTICLTMYMPRGQICNVHVLCIVIKTCIVNNGEIEVGPDSRKVQL